METLKELKMQIRRFDNFPVSYEEANDISAELDNRYSGELAAPCSIDEFSQQQVIEFRNMREEDIEKALLLWDSEPFLGVTDSDSEDRLISYLNNNKGLSFVAYDGNNLIGTVLAGHDSRRSFINHLCVDDKYRHMGIGTKLVEICERALSKELPLRSYIMVYSDNENALRFWEGHGYQLDEKLLVLKKNIS